MERKYADTEILSQRFSIFVLLLSSVGRFFVAEVFDGGVMNIRVMFMLMLLGFCEAALAVEASEAEGSGGYETLALRGGAMETCRRGPDPEVEPEPEPQLDVCGEGLVDYGCLCEISHGDLIEVRSVTSCSYCFNGECYD
ncbi:hypothetical protein [Alloalcanivorax profundimaris]|uniref:hypothetical protein n=1 Tax=Alloalcanivorax profundimaris TaxID=2735259 RepID=UPI0018914FEB|nr:hypothetical protein [Alloalcanivorax profundimaris]